MAFTLVFDRRFSQSLAAVVGRIRPWLPAHLCPLSCPHNWGSYRRSWVCALPSVDCRSVTCINEDVVSGIRGASVQYSTSISAQANVVSAAANCEALALRRPEAGQRPVWRYRRRHTGRRSMTVAVTWVSGWPVTSAWPRTWRRVSPWRITPQARVDLSKHRRRVPADQRQRADENNTHKHKHECKLDQCLARGSATKSWGHGSLFSMTLCLYVIVSSKKTKTLVRRYWRFRPSLLVECMAHFCRVAQRHALRAIHEVRHVQKAVAIKCHCYPAAPIGIPLRAEDSATKCYMWSCVRSGREPDDQEEMGARLYVPLQPKIQAAGAEVVELRVHREPLTRCINTSDSRRKWQIDSQCMTALHIMGER